MHFQLIHSNDKALLATLLRDAEEDVARVMLAIEDAANTAYVVFVDGLCVGALLMYWQSHESEILYLAIDEPFRGYGYGTTAIAQIVTEARSRGVHSIVVGTANSSLDNIAFYQKRGFRMDSVRKNYFDYLETPVHENGILMQDMLMLRMEIPVYHIGIAPY